MNRVEFNQIPPRVEYSLTDNYLQLVPALESIFNWGQERLIRENFDLLAATKKK